MLGGYPLQGIKCFKRLAWTEAVRIDRFKRNGERVGDDPWEANTLEWATTSPPPPYNFDTLPPIRSERPVFDLRHKHHAEHLAADASIVEAPGSHA